MLPLLFFYGRLVAFDVCGSCEVFLDCRHDGGYPFISQLLNKRPDLEFVAWRKDRVTIDISDIDQCSSVPTLVE
jgi:hypothetical protein